MRARPPGNERATPSDVELQAELIWVDRFAAFAGGDSRLRDVGRGSDATFHGPGRPTLPERVGSMTRPTLAAFGADQMRRTKLGRAVGITWTRGNGCTPDDQAALGPSPFMRDIAVRFRDQVDLGRSKYNIWCVFCRIRRLGRKNGRSGMCFVLHNPRISRYLRFSKELPVLAALC